MAKSSKSHPTDRPFRRFMQRLAAIFFLYFSFFVIYCDALIERRFAENRWVAPAKVYARPLTFYSGLLIQTEHLEQELQLLGYRKKVKATRPGEYERYDNYFAIYGRGFHFFDRQQKAQRFSLVIESGQISQLTSLDTNQPLAYQRLDPLLLGSINPLVKEQREVVNIQQVPVYLMEALIASEDRQFYHHWGLSITGILRAFSRNLAEGKAVQGGSTITQQLVKNYFLTNEKKLTRKITEAIMAVLLEWRYSKSEILQAYINEVYLGQDGALSIHGFAKASEFFFNRKLEDINLAQAATLVALVRGPSYYEPRRHPERALKRRNLILDLMLSQQRINQQQWELATSKSLAISQKSPIKSSRMPAAMELIRLQLREHYSQEQLEHGSLKVFTTLDPVVQKQSEKALQSRLNKLDANSQKQLQGAVVVSHRFSGEVLAVVGDRQPNYQGFNRALHAYRQTGSVIKPFVYLTALQASDKYSLSSSLSDQSFSMTATDGSVWRPQNYDRKEHGEVSIQRALIESYNLATAHLALSVGVDEVIELLRQAGYTRPLIAFPSLALGAKEMSPWEVLKLYQSLASGGLVLDTSVISSVMNNQGQLLSRYPVIAKKKLSEDSVFLINHTLQQVVRRGTAKSLHWRLPQLNLAGKTGTTNDTKDSWFAGMSENFLSVVWVGRDDNKSTGLTGATGAMKVWGDLIAEVEQEALILQPPGAIEWRKGRADEACIPHVKGGSFTATQPCGGL
ncbi:penicillin-binding protein 1B [Pleionea sp. CnH1-48]|uniref:penicillin-binding protein 1B n=1 Tax=Pleionea sp. CnH1-48 TaxID=2954494 RepID=UPI002097E5D9|nr:penicillin-binding protein 1B [Pleionea sp. CnH1-48]MCO7227345.1 penicillin-binding protein 1B [Pleionea sp. CnH1-48]